MFLCSIQLIGTAHYPDQLPIPCKYFLTFGQKCPFYAVSERGGYPERHGQRKNNGGRNKSCVLYSTRGGEEADNEF